MQYASARVLIYDDHERMRHEWAERLCALAREAIAARGVFTLALTGGTTPAPFYERLAGDPFRDALDWSRSQVFFGDERAVGPDDPRSNYGLARDAWLGEGPVPRNRIHRMRGEAEDLAAAAADYEDAVRERVAAGTFGLPTFDLILLGLGGDGHVASLFPGTAALEERKRLVVANEVPQQEAWRLSFTYPLINAAREVWMMVSGGGKAEPVARALGHLPGGEALPVWHVRPADGRLTWWLDRAAAAHIPEEEQDLPAE